MRLDLTREKNKARRLTSSWMAHQCSRQKASCHETRRLHSLPWDKQTPTRNTFFESLPCSMEQLSHQCTCRSSVKRARQLELTHRNRTLGRSFRSHMKLRQSTHTESATNCTEKNFTTQATSRSCRDGRWHKLRQAIAETSFINNATPKTSLVHAHEERYCHTMVMMTRSAATASNSPSEPCQWV